MKRLSLLLTVDRSKIGRLAIVLATGLALSVGASIKDHEYYWNRTIKHVQTVDLNLLFHFAPHKLSNALVQDDINELQRTLDSNYGLFGIVITNCKQQAPDCSDQAILYSSHSTHRWKQELRVEDLSKHPFDYLRNPAPIAAEQRFAAPKEQDILATGNQNQGVIIGRVYYVRGVSPTFWQDYSQWLTGLNSNSGAHRGYRTTTIVFILGSLFTGLVMELLLHRKQQNFEVEQKQFQQEIQNLEREKLITRRQQEILSQNLKQLQAKLEAEKSTQNQLQQEIAQLRQEDQQDAQKLHHLNDLLQKSKNHEKELESNLDQKDAELQDQQMRIKKLEQSIQDLDQRNKEIVKFNNRNRRKLESAAQLINSLKQKTKEVKLLSKQKDDYEEKATNYSNQLCQLQEEYNSLQQEFADLEDQTAELIKLKANLHNHNIAIVGGHERVFEKASKNLREKYNFKGFLVHIPPSNRATVSEHALKDQIQNCHIVVVVTRYMGHDLSTMVTNLKNRNALSGQVLLINERGATGIVRKIVEYANQTKEK